CQVIRKRRGTNLHLVCAALVHHIQEMPGPGEGCMVVRFEQRRQLWWEALARRLAFDILLREIQQWQPLAVGQDVTQISPEEEYCPVRETRDHGAVARFAMRQSIPIL